MEKTLVTFARNRIAYTIIKSLSKRGIRTVTADSINFAMSYYSRYSNEHFVYPDFHKDEKGFINCLIKESKKRKIRVIIAGHEEAYVIARYAELFKENNLKIAIPSKEQISITHNKSEISELAEQLGIKVPKTFRFTSRENFSTRAKEIIKYPVIVKLIKTRGGIGYQKIHNQNELRNAYLETVENFNIAKKEDFPIVQEFIDGYGLGVSLLFDQGKPVASFTHKRIWECPPEGGFSIERVSVHNKKAETAAKRLLEKLRWHGVAMVEFRIDHKTNEPWLLEVNPRFWGSVNQAVTAGVDFPYLTYQVANNIKPKEVFNYKIGIRTRWLAGMLVEIPAYLKNMNRWKYLKSLLKFFSKDLYYDDFSLSDPIPFFVEFIKPIQDILGGKSLRDQDFEDVRNEYVTRINK